MRFARSILRPRRWLVILSLIVVGESSACSPISVPAPPTFPKPPIAVITRQPTPSPTTISPLTQIPEFPEFEASPEFSVEENLKAVHYYNPAGVVVARYDPIDLVHNQHISWNWEVMSALEKSQVVSWLFDPHQMHYGRFQDREEWVIHALTKWIPRLNDLALPSDPAIAIHWQTDGPPTNQTTLYEALSRVKSLVLVPERPMCSYGYSHLGLIEYGGELVLFTAPAWQKVSVETREILTTVWTLKEAMVIYYAQSLGWANSCPSESAHLEIEYYSTLWLLVAEQTLSRLVPSDRGYWENQEIPLQSKRIVTQIFPACSTPILWPAPTPEPGCSPLP